MSSCTSSDTAGCKDKEGTALRAKSEDAPHGLTSELHGSLRGNDPNLKVGAAYTYRLATLLT
jgi:hypothetical protein